MEMATVAGSSRSSRTAAREGTAVSDSGNLTAWLLAAGRDEAPALLHRGRTVTYGQLRREVDALAAALVETGAGRGERVGLLADNTPFFVLAYLATIRAGLCSVPFPAGTNEATFGRLAEQAGMRRVLVQARHLGRAAPWCARLSLEVWPEGGWAARVPADAAAALQGVAVDPVADPTSIIFTSGSTGVPKGVMISHRNIACNTGDIIAYLGLSERDRVLAVLSLSYCYGASLLHTHLRVGGSVVLVESFVVLSFPERVLDEMEATACTGFAGVPSTYQILLRRSGFARRRFPALRWLQQAGGRLPTPFIRELRQAHPDVTLYVMYGQTEATARLSYLPPEQLDAKLGSIGRGLPSTRLEVLGPKDQPVRPGSDEVGEIVASGENIALGYWQDPAETARFFRDGRLRTGDLARVDADGFIYIVDRSRDFLKCMGNRVGPKEIEEVIAEHPGVVEAAVIGVPDEVWGEAPWAFVVPVRPGTVTPEAVVAHCKARLPSFKVPQFVTIVEDLPRNSSGKVFKPQLRERALQQQPRQLEIRVSGRSL